MPETSKLVLGTAAWGSGEYGLNKNMVPMRMIRAILGTARINGVTKIHYKPAYKTSYGVPDQVLDMAKAFGYQVVAPPDSYDTKTTAKLCAQHECVSVIFNPLRQDELNATRDNNLTPPVSDFCGTVYVRSVLMQGMLAKKNPAMAKSLVQQIGQAGASALIRKQEMLDREAHDMGMNMVQYCLAGAFSHPYVDYVILGINSLGELQTALDVMRSGKKITYPQELNCGHKDFADPRKWDLRGGGNPSMESEHLSSATAELAGNMAIGVKGRRRRRGR